MHTCTLIQIEQMHEFVHTQPCPYMLERLKNNYCIDDMALNSGTKYMKKKLKRKIADIPIQADFAPK